MDPRDSENDALGPLFSVLENFFGDEIAEVPTFDSLDSTPTFSDDDDHLSETDLDTSDDDLSELTDDDSRDKKRASAAAEAKKLLGKLGKKLAAEAEAKRAADAEAAEAKRAAEAEAAEAEKRAAEAEAAEAKRAAEAATAVLAVLAEAEKHAAAAEAAEAEKHDAEAAEAAAEAKRDAEAEKRAVEAEERAAAADEDLSVGSLLQVDSVANLPPRHDDVTAVHNNAKKEDQDATQNKTNAEDQIVEYQKPIWTAVIDTWSLVEDGGECVSKLIDLAKTAQLAVDADGASLDEINIVIPHMLWSELDDITERLENITEALGVLSQSGSSELEWATELSQKANKAKEMLREKMEAESMLSQTAREMGGVCHPRIVEQTGKEMKEASEKYRPSGAEEMVNDDHVLACALANAAKDASDDETSTAPTSLVAGGTVLLTNSQNLSSKALSNNVRVFSIEDFVRHITDRSEERKEQLTFSNVAGVGTTETAPVTSVQVPIPTPPKKHHDRSKDIGSRNIEAQPKRIPTDRSVGSRISHRVTPQQKTRRNRYDKLCRSTRTHKRSDSSVAVASVASRGWLQPTNRYHHQSSVSVVSSSVSSRSTYHVTRTNGIRSRNTKTQPKRTQQKTRSRYDKLCKSATRTQKRSGSPVSVAE